MHGIKVLMAKNYIDNLSRGSAQGYAGESRAGHLADKCPLGYRNITGPDGKKIIGTDPANRADALLIVAISFPASSEPRHGSVSSNGEIAWDSAPNGHG
jgi:hypothetical protein